MSTPLFSPPQSPSSETISYSNLYFGGEVFHSPENSDSDSDSNASNTTLEDVDSYAQFGYPLQRMVRVGVAGSGSSVYRSILPSGSTSSSSVSSSIAYDIDYEALIDDILAENPFFKTEARFGNMLMVEPSSPNARDSLMIKRISRISEELDILLELNHPKLRQDPWNPVPHVVCTVERGENVFLCMERLSLYNEPPFKTIANYIDFFRQVLEGLTFLHELNIAQITLEDTSCYMVDLSSAPHTCSLPSDFDRIAFPVRYYFTNLSHAIKVEASPAANSPEVAPFKYDVQNCGMMIDRLLNNVPSIGPKFKSLVKAMVTREFGADDARKLFEALCKSLKSSTLEAPIPLESGTGENT